jgi:hypothetical protein
MTDEPLRNGPSTPAGSSVDFGETDRRLRDLQAALESLSRARSQEPPASRPGRSSSSGYFSSAISARWSSSPGASPLPAPTPATPPPAPPAQPPRRGVEPIFLPSVGSAPTGHTAAPTPESVPEPAPEPGFTEAEAPGAPFVAEPVSIPASAPIPAPEHGERPVDFAAAKERARAIVAQAEADASRIVAEANQEVADLKRQIEDLIALRDRIQRSGRGGTDPPEAAAAPPPAAPGWVFGSEPGVLSLTAGTFADLDELERLERALTCDGAVQDVYLRAWDSGRGVFELTISEPLPVVEELRRVSPLAFTVDHESVATLSLALHPETGDEPSGEDPR